MGNVAHSSQVRLAVVLAGGKGSRLRKYSGGLLKPLMPIAGNPILSYVVRGLAGSGVDSIVVAGGEDSSELCDAMGSFDGAKLVPVKAGTPSCCVNHSLLACADELDGPFVLAHGDIIPPIGSFGALQDEFSRLGNPPCLAALSPHPRITTHPYSRADKTGRLREIRLRKPMHRGASSEKWLCWIGLTVLDRSVLEMLPSGGKLCGVPEALLANRIDSLVVMSFIVRDYWFHLAYLKDLVEARRGLPRGLLEGYGRVGSDNRVDFLP